MPFVPLNPSADINQNITGRNTLSVINKTQLLASLDCMQNVDKWMPILPHLSPIRTIAVEGKRARSVGELTEEDISHYKADWLEKWLLVLEEAGYSNFFALADIADVDDVAEVRRYSDL